MQKLRISYKEEYFPREVKVKFSVCNDFDEIFVGQFVCTLTAENVVRTICLREKENKEKEAVRILLQISTLYAENKWSRVKCPHYHE